MKTGSRGSEESPVRCVLLFCCGKPPNRVPSPSLAIFSLRPGRKVRSSWQSPTSPSKPRSSYTMKFSSCVSGHVLFFFPSFLLVLRWGKAGLQLYFVEFLRGLGKGPSFDVPVAAFNRGHSSHFICSLFFFKPRGLFSKFEVSLP